MAPSLRLDRYPLGVVGHLALAALGSRSPSFIFKKGPMKSHLVPVVLLVGSGAISLPLSAAPTVDELVVGPASTEVQYVLSDRGGHAAAVTRKGSRMTVVVDGVAGPKVDGVSPPSLPWIDPRPIQATIGAANIAAGRHAVDQQAVRPVTFSADGKHFAYLARQSQEWVLIEDNNELLRLPVGQGSDDFRLQFAGADGKHLLFAHGEYMGFNLWVDGKQWPGFFGSGGGGSEGTIDPIVSPDGEHVAYVAQIDREKRALIVDGRDAGYFGVNLSYTSDSRHLLCIAQSPKGMALLMDGKVLFSGRQLISYTVAPVTNRIAAVLTHEFPDHTRGQFVLLDGKPVEATLCKSSITKVLFSPDGRHFAAQCSNAPNINYIVTDGKKGQEYDIIGGPSVCGGSNDFAFSPDSGRSVYVARASGKYFVVINGEETDDAFDSVLGFRFSADGKRLAYAGVQNNQPKSPVIIDGKAEHFERGIDFSQFDFSPDGSHYAYIGPGNYGGAIYVDGKALPLAATNFVFSPDGKHIAITGYRVADNVNGLWLDGEMVYRGERHPDFLTFSADSQHLYWKVLEANPTKSGYFDQVTYADGKAVARGDNVGLYGAVTVPVGYSPYTVHPGWQAVGDSGLVCFAPVDDTVKRYTIAPGDTNLGTAVAAAQVVSPHPAAAIAAPNAMREK